MPRALLLVGQLPPPRGGVSVHVEALRDALRTRAVAVRVLDTRASEHASLRPLGLGIAAARLLAGVARDTLVHVHTNGHNRASWALAASCLVRLRPGSPRPLLTVHSGLAPGYIHDHARAVRAIVAGYAGVIAVSEPIAVALRAAGVADDRIERMPAFVAAAAEARLTPAALARARARHRPLLAAALAPGSEYGAPDLLEASARAARSLPDLGLAIFGPGTRSSELRDLARHHRIEGRCWFFGELHHAEALGLVAAADLFVRPTRADGDSLSLREALAAGTPAIATDAAPRPAGAVLCRAADPSALAEAIVSICAGSPARTSTAPISQPDALPRLLAIYRELGLPVEEGEAPCAASLAA